MVINHWLKEGKKAAVCFTIDDLHPAKASVHGYDAGGDLDKGAFGHVDWLLKRHPELKVTLFTTADWREKSPFPTRKWLSRIPWLRDQFFLADLFPKGTMQLDRHKEFVDYYNAHPQVEIGFHGLHHCHKGLKVPVEFQDEPFAFSDKRLAEMRRIFKASGISFVNGFTPPAWYASPALQEALVHNGMLFLASARDIKSEIAAAATNQMSGVPGVSILYPEYVLDGRLIHFPTNFQATSTWERAEKIVHHGGIVSIKAHIIKEAFGFKMLDGVDRAYMEYLDEILSKMREQFGNAIWWTSMNEITQNILSHGNSK